MRLELDKTARAQVFEGFGASGAWWAQYAGGWTRTDPASGLPVRDQISRLLFSKTAGIGLRTFRYNLGAGSAFSGRGRYDDDARRTESFDLGPGQYDFSRDANAVYMLRQAVRDGAEEVVFFVNSPIERLTKNHMGHQNPHAYFRTNLPRGNIGAFADYCLDVTAHFLREGLPVRFLSPVNEPLWVWNGGQEGCHYKPRQAARVLRVFAEKMAQRGDLPGLRLSGVENGDIRWFNKCYTRQALRAPAVRAVMDGIDLHSYCLPAPLPRFFNDRVGFLRRFRRWMDRRYPGVPVRMSEWTHMRGGQDAGMDSALETAKIIYEDLTILNAVSWQHWIACSHYDYCDGLLYLDRAAQSYTLTKRYFVTGNFSKYIPHGAVRFAVTDADGDLLPLGFLAGAQTILVLINPGQAAQTLTAPGDGLRALTDAAHDLTETPMHAGEALTLPPRSVTTLCFKEADYATD